MVLVVANIRPGKYECQLKKQHSQIQFVSDTFEFLPSRLNQYPFTQNPYSWDSLGRVGQAYFLHVLKGDQDNGDRVGRKRI